MESIVNNDKNIGFTEPLRPQRQPKTWRRSLLSYRTSNWRKSIANDIAFIEIGQLEGEYENQIDLYNLKS